VVTETAHRTSHRRAAKEKAKAAIEKVRKRFFFGNASSVVFFYETDDGR
jgi:hypothetical protein